MPDVDIGDLTTRRKLFRHEVARKPFTDDQVLGYNASTGRLEPITASGVVHDAVTLAADADTLLGLSTQQLTLDSQSANRVFAGPTSGGAADPSFRALVSADLPTSVVETTDADYIDLTDGGTTALHSHSGAVGAHAMLDGGTVHTDSTTDSVTRGSLIYGNSTPKWDELNVGEDGQFIRTDGTDTLWNGIVQGDVRGQGGPHLGHSRTEGTMVALAADNTSVFGPYKLLVDMTVASGWAQLRITAATGPCRMVIYEDNGSGVPGAHVDTSDEVTISDTTADGAWTEFTFSSPALTAQTSYWIGVISDNGSIQMGMTSSVSADRLVTDISHRVDTTPTYPTPSDPFTDSSNTVRVGACYLEGSAGSGSGAPTNAQYLTLATDATLTVERVFTPGQGLQATDAGAGSTYTVNAAEVMALSMMAMGVGG